MVEGITGVGSKKPEGKGGKEYTYSLDSIGDMQSACAP